jgi:hypothetical protein
MRMLLLTDAFNSLLECNQFGLEYALDAFANFSLKCHTKAASKTNRIQVHPVLSGEIRRQNNLPEHANRTRHNKFHCSHFAQGRASGERRDNLPQCAGAVSRR